MKRGKRVALTAAMGLLSAGCFGGVNAGLTQLEGEYKRVHFSGDGSDSSTYRMGTLSTVKAGGVKEGAGKVTFLPEDDFASLPMIANGDQKIALHMPDYTFDQEGDFFEVSASFTSLSGEESPTFSQTFRPGVEAPQTPGKANFVLSRQEGFFTFQIYLGEAWSSWLPDHPELKEEEWRIEDLSVSYPEEEKVWYADLSLGSSLVNRQNPYPALADGVEPLQATWIEEGEEVFIPLGDGETVSPMDILQKLPFDAKEKFEFDELPKDYGAYRDDPLVLECEQVFTRTYGISSWKTGEKKELVVHIGKAYDFSPKVFVDGRKADLDGSATIPLSIPSYLYDDPVQLKRFALEKVVALENWTSLEKEVSSYDEARGEILLSVKASQGVKTVRLKLKRREVEKFPYYLKNDMPYYASPAQKLSQEWLIERLLLSEGLTASFPSHPLSYFEGDNWKREGSYPTLCRIFDGKGNHQDWNFNLNVVALAPGQARFRRSVTLVTPTTAMSDETLAARVARAGFHTFREVKSVTILEGPSLDGSNDFEEEEWEASVETDEETFTTSTKIVVLDPVLETDKKEDGNDIEKEGSEDQNFQKIERDEGIVEDGMDEGEDPWEAGGSEGVSETFTASPEAHQGEDFFQRICRILAEFFQRIFFFGK